MAVIVGITLFGAVVGTLWCIGYDYVHTSIGVTNKMNRIIDSLILALLGALTLVVFMVAVLRQ